jgi:RhoGEF domain
MNHPASAQLHAELMRRKKSSFLQFSRATWGTLSSQSLSLDSYLIKPIQRFMKYPLLMRELIATTNTSHADYVPLKTALALTQDIIRKVNESKREEENLNKLTSIETQIHGLNIKLVMRGRRFIR